MAKAIAIVRLIVSSAFVLRLCVHERRTINRHDARSMKDVIKTHIFDVREFFQSEDNGMKCNQE